MSHKKSALFFLLGSSSIVAGAVFGLLDIFGFVDGRHALSLQLLLGAAGITYVIVVLTYLLNLASRGKMYILFGVSSMLFGITFFAMNINPVLSALSTLMYLAFLTYVYTASHARSQMFITFSPREIFFPILRVSFTFFLVLLAVSTYMQSQKLISHNNLISPTLIRLVSKPSVALLNKQINAQLSVATDTPQFQALPPTERTRVVHRALSETVEGMADPRTGRVYDFTPDEIPTNLATVSPSGTVDITPVIEAMLPAIAYKLNVQVREYAVLAPFAVAALTYLLLQPVMVPFQIIESLITLLLFKVLIKTHFIVLESKTQTTQVPTLIATTGQ